MAPEVSPERVQQFAFAFAPPILLEAAIHLGVFDRLDAASGSGGKGKTAQELAEAASVTQRGMRCLCDALVGLAFLAKDDAGRYSLTPESAAFLVSNKPGFQGGLFRHISSQLLPGWMQLTQVVRDGKPAVAVNREATGGEFFKQFVEDLFPRGYPAARVLAEALHIGKSPQPYKVLDLAAGSGVWSIAAAQQSPQVRVTAVDWADVIPVTKAITARHKVAEQYTFVAGDLATADFGSGFHLATLGHIVHSEGEARSKALFAKVFRALAPGGVIAIAEMMPNEDRRGPAFALIFAVNMLVHTDQGDTFTFGEMSRWLKETGFVNVRTLEAPAPSPLVLAEKLK